MYKDKLVTLQAPSQPAVTGHAQIVLEENTSLRSADDFAHMLSLASFMSSALFEKLGAHGSNIIFSDLGTPTIDVVGRFESDELMLRWDPISLMPDEMESVMQKIKDKCDYIGVSTTPKNVVVQETKPVFVEKEEEEVDDEKKVHNYLLRKLDRLP